MSENERRGERSQERTSSPVRLIIRHFIRYARFCDLSEVFVEHLYLLVMRKTRTKGVPYNAYNGLQRLPLYFIFYLLFGFDETKVKELPLTKHRLNRLDLKK